MTITIYGAGDDCVEVEGCEGADEFYVDRDGKWWGDLVAPGATEQLRLYAESDATRNGCWLIAAQQTDEEVPFPPWSIAIEQSEKGYSCRLLIDAPAGTRLTNLHPKPNND